MAAEVRNFVVSVPASTAVATPQTTALTMPARIVEHIRVRIPPGPLGQVGWAIAMNGVPVIPTNTGGWIVGDDEVIEWDVRNQPSSGAWQLMAYNTGRNAHTLQITFSLGLPQEQAADQLSAPLVIEA